LTRQTGSANQDIGISAAFLADVKPQADGCNSVRYNLTPEIIQSIFKTYPAGTVLNEGPGDFTFLFAKLMKWFFQLSDLEKNTIKSPFTFH
jgi:hypothetical protein